jgi:hypothetical protein
LPSIDLGLTYVIERDDQPVFFVEIKPPGHVNIGSARLAADTQMRHRFRDLCPHTPVRKLHGISAMGQRLAFYSMNTRTTTVAPREQPTSPTLVTNPVPANWWDLDITAEEGHQRFMEVVDDVKAMVATL